MSSKRLLAAGLLGLAALYAWWFGRGEHAAAALVFVLPPMLLAVLAWRGWRQARFWSGVLALFWFSHGVMLAWAEPAQRALALAAVALSLLVVYASSMDGVRARLLKR